MLLSVLLLGLFLPDGIVSNTLPNIEWKTTDFQVMLHSSEPYEAKENPIPVDIYFSQPVKDFNESFLIAENGVVSSFYKVSEQKYHFSLLVTQPGIVSISLSDRIHSSEASALSFFYQGTTILSRSITKVSETEARFLLTTNKPAILYSYITPSTLVPTETEIVSQGSAASIDSPTSYSIDFASLQPGVTYYVYTTGKEFSGTPIASTIQESSISFKTKGIAEPSTCATTQIVASTGELIDAICNNHGICSSGSCKCERGYSDTSCSTITSQLPSSDQYLLHGTFVFLVTLHHADELALYIQNSIHEAFASYCGVEVSAIHIRKIEFTNSATPTEKRVQIQLTLLEVLENEQLEEEIKNTLLLRSINVQSFERKHIELQTSEDDWRCHNGVKEEEEGDVDCGGPCIRKCTKEQTCNQTNDCEDGLECKNSHCEPTPAVVPVLGICICVACMFLFVGTLLSQIQGKVMTIGLCDR